MKNKSSFKLPYLLFAVITIVISIALFNCNENIISSPETEQTELSFPEFFIEKGSDLDTSYISFRGTKKNNDTLEIQATSWGIRETGLLLTRHNSNKKVQFQMMGRCGTVLTRTWLKVDLTEWITAKEIDTLIILSFTNFRDTLTIVKTTIQ